MRKVTQEREGYPFGDCVRASYASLLEIPLKDVPHFDPRFDQYNDEREWLQAMGMDLVTVPAKDNRPPSAIPEEMYHLMSGRSPRHPEYGHRVVGKGGNVYWDPHPSRLGIANVREYHFIVPLHPWLHVEPIKPSRPPEPVADIGGRRRRRRRGP